MMKNINVFINCLFVFLIFPAISFGQVPSIADFYNKIKNQENVKEIKIQGWLIKLAANFTDEADSKKLLRKVSMLRALIMENGNTIDVSEHKRLIRDLQQQEYQPLIQVRDGCERVDLMIREKDDHISDALLIVHGDDNFILLSIEGNFLFSDLNNLDFDINGNEYFKKLPENKGDLPKA